jgi:hypothetical protein
VASSARRRCGGRLQEVAAAWRVCSGGEGQWRVCRRPVGGVGPGLGLGVACPSGIAGRWPAASAHGEKPGRAEREERAERK